MPAWTSSATTEAAARVMVSRPEPNWRGAVNRVLLRGEVKPLLFALSLWPLAALLWGAWSDSLGANPAEHLIRSTGDWTLRFLCLTLAVTPLRQIGGWPALARLRRMLGLFAFFYGAIHFCTYGWLDKGFEIADIAKDIGKRPFILVGTAALLLMAPLAASSFNRAIKALGAPRWQALHRLVYAVAGLGLLHFFWMRASKQRFGEVAVYAVVLGLLLGWRLWRRLGARRPTAG